MLEFSASISEVPFVGPRQTERLKKLNIHTVSDLLLHFPQKYIDSTNVLPIAEVRSLDKAAIKGTVRQITNSYTRARKTITRALIEDPTGTITLVWFNQPYLIKSIRKGEEYLFEIRKPKRGGDFYCTTYEKVSSDGAQLHLGRISPVYKQTEGISTKWLRSRISHVIDNTDVSKWDKHYSTAKELLPHPVTLSDALHAIHFPQSQENLQNAAERLQFDELLTLMFEMEEQRKATQKSNATPLKVNQKQLDELINTLPFQLTEDQHTAINKIVKDLSKNKPMHRLLNGDVGSGKTVVALAAAYLTVKSGHSVILLAPTTVLAQQHYNTFLKLLDITGVPIYLKTSAHKDQIRSESSIIIGTHALLFEENLPQNCALLIIDEQHRFGVKQRQHLRETLNRDTQPHYLTMTATPIPRTLTNALYGDMDVSFIETMPAKRKKVSSYLVPYSKRDGCYKWVAEHIKESGEQAFVVFPLIEGDQSSSNKSLIEQYKLLSKKYFGDLKTELLHGKMKDDQKTSTLMNFRNKSFDILFSTTVIEVGVDIPDATIILIEGADSFGLAQLHQLRGRIGRNDKEGYCYVIPSEGVEKDSNTADRLKYFVNESSGFKISEYDLKSRGPGEILGERQAGVTNLLIADLFDSEGVKRAKKAADKLLPLRPKTIFDLRRDSTET